MLATKAHQFTMFTERQKNAFNLNLRYEMFVYRL